MTLAVLHVTQPTTDGVARHVRDAVADQTARGWRVAVASPPDVALVSDVQDHGATHCSWDAGRAPTIRTVAQTGALREIVDAVDPDVVHLHSSKAGLAGRLAVRRRRPTLFTPHAWSFLHGGALTRALALRWEQHAARWTTTIICVSEAERAMGRDRGIDATMIVLPNAVDLDRFTPLSGPHRRDVRARLGIADAPTATCVGRFVAQKGQDDLLEAWTSVREHVPRATLLLVGDGPGRAALEARHVPGVRFLDARADVAELLAAADVAVIPSRWEGMSYVLLEAIACGTPVVATDVAGAREILEGLPDAIVPVGDVPALAAAVASRLAAPERTRAGGAHARERARDFDLERWGERLARVTEAAATS